MLTNIRISTIYNRLPTVFIGFSRFCRGVSKVRDSESLLFQLAVNRD